MTNDFKSAVLERCAAKPAKWDQQTLAMVIGVDPSNLGRILDCKVYRKYGLPAQFAMNLAVALGETAEFWMMKQIGVLLREASVRMGPELAAIRERAANWKPGAVVGSKPKSKSYMAGYADGFREGRAEAHAGRHPADASTEVPTA